MPKLTGRPHSTSMLPPPIRPTRKPLIAWNTRPWLYSRPSMRNSSRMVGVTQPVKYLGAWEGGLVDDQHVAAGRV